MFSKQTSTEPVTQMNKEEETEQLLKKVLPSLSKRSIISVSSDQSNNNTSSDKCVRNKEISAALLAELKDEISASKELEKQIVDAIIKYT